jgi:hypothetical protein
MVKSPAGKISTVEHKTGSQHEIDAFPRRARHQKGSDRGAAGNADYRISSAHPLILNNRCISFASSAIIRALAYIGWRRDSGNNLAGYSEIRTALIRCNAINLAY